MLERTNVVEKGVERLVWALQEKPNVTKMLEVFLQEIQEIEDLLLSILEVKDINTAKGVQLDNIGYILGQYREGRGDEEFREALLQQININTANGTYQTIYDIIKEYTNSDRLRITPSSMAFASLYINGQKNISLNTWKLLDQIKPAGTKWIIKSDFYDNAFLFAWEKKSDSLETLLVTLDGDNYEPLQVTLNGVDYENLLVGFEGVNYYDKSIVEGRNTFYWETPIPLLVTLDGINYEPLIIPEFPTDYQELRVEAPWLEDYIPQNVRPFTWEINNLSKEIV